MDPDTCEDVPDSEIWGLWEDSHGRSCERHKFCGKSLRPGEVVRFIKLKIPGQDDDAIEAVRIEDGCEMCVVGFLPQRLTSLEPEKYENKEAQIISIYEEEEELEYKNEAKLRKGIASFRLFRNIPRQVHT